MLKKKIEDIKKLIIKDNTTTNKRIENLVFFVIILIVTIISINVIWRNDTNRKDKNEINDNNKELALENSYINSNSNTTDNINFENNLKEILSKMQGVGRVEVLITYSETSKIIPMYNEDSKTSYIEEKDSNGGTRKTEQTDLNKEIIYQEVNGEQTPITQNMLMPKIEGAIIIAQGANDLNIKSNIIQAVEAATGLATHKIQVFEFSKNNY